MIIVTTWKKDSPAPIHFLSRKRNQPSHQCSQTNNISTHPWDSIFKEEINNMTSLCNPRSVLQLHHKSVINLLWIVISYSSKNIKYYQIYQSPEHTFFKSMTDKWTKGALYQLRIAQIQKYLGCSSENLKLRLHSFWSKAPAKIFNYCG